MKTRLRSLVLGGVGINCQEELAQSYENIGIETKVVHLQDLLSCRVKLKDYDIFSIPGGFSFGDELGAGKALANRIRYFKREDGSYLLDELTDFIKEKGFVLGICNGFQALVCLGLLPGIELGGEPQVSLIANQSGKFIDRWVYLKSEGGSPGPFSDKRLWNVPIRHKEGRLLVEDPRIREAIIEKKLLVFSYADEVGRISDGSNPNGSFACGAGLTDPSGFVLGLMPHPEAYLSLYNHPNWQQKKIENSFLNEEGDGQIFFNEIISFIKKKKGLESE